MVFNPFKTFVHAGYGAITDDDSAWGDSALATSKRVGVPGGARYRGDWRDMCRWRGTAWYQMASGSTLMHLLLYAALALGYMTISFDDDGNSLLLTEKEALIDAQIMSALTYITTFSLGTYLAQILGRYHERFNNCCQTNGHMTLISLISAAELPNCPREAATLMRWANLMMHMYYMMVEGGLTEKKWQILRERRLVTADEETALRDIKKKPSVVYVWACRLVHDLHERQKLTSFHAKRLEGCLSGCRGLAAKQIAYTLTPIPLPVFSLMHVIINVYIMFMGWNSAVRLVNGLEVVKHSDPTASLTTIWSMDIGWAAGTEVGGFIVVILAFNVMRQIAEDLTDPYGNDATDYHLDFDLLNLWAESKEAIANMEKNKDGADLASQMIKASFAPKFAIENGAEEGSCWERRSKAPEVKAPTINGAAVGHMLC